MRTIEVSWLYKHDYLPLGRLGGSTHGNIRWVSKQSLKENSIGFYIFISEEKMYFQPVYYLIDEYEAKEELNYKISLTTTRCNYGGRRYWFICPLIFNQIRCGRRVGVLYMGDKYFGCRHCRNICYSRNENRRHKFQWMAMQWQLEEKEEALEKSILTKRRWYDGRPTKIQRKLSMIKRKLYGVDRSFY